MAQFPNLAGVATNDLVEKIGGSFAASYINWSRTLQLLRQNIELEGVKLTQDDFSASCFFGILALLEVKEHLLDKVLFVYVLEV